MSFELFAFIFWLGLSLLTMHAVGVLTENALGSARAYGHLGKSRWLGFFEGVRFAFDELARVAVHSLVSSPRATTLVLAYVAAALYWRIAGPAAIVGSAMALWVWMALAVPATLGRLGLSARSQAKKARTR